MRKILLAIIALGCLGAQAQSFLQIRQELIPYNLRATNGVPLSTTNGVPIGSNGKGPTDAEQSAAFLPASAATIRGFSGFAASGGVPLILSSNKGTATGFTAVAVAVQMPRSPSIGVPTIVLRRSLIGNGFYAQQVSFKFGAVIPQPAKDEAGNALLNPETYWLAEPYTINGHTNSGYYWSRNASKVFAVQTGPVTVRWVKATAEIGEFGGNTNYFPSPSNPGSYYRLVTVNYVVSGLPVKEPRKMYWTEGDYATIGRKIVVPASRVDDITIAYNKSFPAWVPPSPDNQLAPTNTLWFNKGLGLISAFNKEGRVFMELLGNTKSDGVTREHLGFEIVDVIREPNPSDVQIELGEKLTAYADGRSDAHLTPAAVNNPSGEIFVYTHLNGARVELYATHETRQLNAFRAYWLEEGEAGLLWPGEYVRYALGWPTDPAKYRHYVRPVVSSETQAQETAIPLPTENAPVIEFQDESDQPRGKLTQDFKFYTRLDASFPAHRTLLRFTSGQALAFERVFSWLDQNVRATNFQTSVANTLAGWNVTNNAAQTLITSNTLNAVRYIMQNVEIGQRINAPANEAAAAPDLNYLAGFIRQNQGTHFSATAYIDPFALGFTEAAKGSIIPVNSTNDASVLEVWWFRPNGADTTKGFKPIYWPSVIARYNLVWPANPSEIVLASNDGSGGLSSLQASGRIYTQNDKSLPGYNPNEEHALMQGGQAYALRDDLNITSGANFSSRPFVLLEYSDADGRPSMRPFKVLRENATQKFEFDVAAGTVLQAPMPLPLMEKPLAPALAGQPSATLNSWSTTWQVSSSTGGNPMDLILRDRPMIRTYSPLVLQNLAQNPITTRWFFPTVANPLSRVVTGLVSSKPPYGISFWTLSAQPPDPNTWKYAVSNAAGLGNGLATVFDPVARLSATGTVVQVSAEAGISYALVAFSPSRPAYATNATHLVMNDVSGPFNYQNWQVVTEKIPENISDATARDLFSKFVLSDRKGDLWVYRGPHEEASRPYMAMQFYYKTLAGFNFPSQPANHQPPVGTITPYLRAQNPDLSYAGDPIFGNFSNRQLADGNALPIYYRPAWPESVPTLHMAETLTLPKRGLPAMRGNNSLETVYQQSQAQGAGDLTRRSAVLHDPTREKVYPLSGGGLSAIPDGVKKQVSRGKTYFPNLPPHLVDRFFFDPTRGPAGSLVFKGQFVDEAVGDDFVLLNVLGNQDRNYLKALCPIGDPKKNAWQFAVDSGLQTSMELFIEDLAKPGTYKVGSSQIIAPAALAEVTDQDVAVDSYALTAMGPGVGYVTLISGNGRAFTPPDAPVSLQVIKVVDTLYPGEVKIVHSSNPLGEKVTLQQVVDLAGAIELYDFEWKIASPAAGLPPPVYENTRVLLLNDGTWSHVRFPLAADFPGAIQNTSTARVANDVITTLVAVSPIAFTAVATNDSKLQFTVAAGSSKLAVGNQITVRNAEGLAVHGVISAGTTSTKVVATMDWTGAPDAFEVFSLAERIAPTLPQSIVFRQFSVASTSVYSQFWLSMDLADSLGARVYIDGQLTVTANMPEDNTPMEAAPNALSPLTRTYRIGGNYFGGGARSGTTITHRVAVQFFSTALPDVAQAFNLRLEAFEASDQTAVVGSPWLELGAEKYQDGVRAIMGDSADVRALSDNYLIMRYRARQSSHASFAAGWSKWTEPQLVEGWIKRVLAGINPFNQRVGDLFNNRVNTDVSILTQAGKRWEGDVALDLEAINDFGLIEIYETVLRRGKGLSIDAGINFGPANDALLLAAGYLSDLYMMLGNEALADASNPTIGIGTKDQTYGDIATSLLAFKGQVPSLLEEELALLRGRDDFLQPGVQTTPFYNRLVWNYTRGIDSGEVIYALNYNVLEDHDQSPDGAINAEDAARMFPQGHGDAYGHFLTALKGYYSLLLDQDFDWVPRIEAVTVLGKPVAVDYQDERKFAAAAAAVARAGKQAFDLTWRRDYHPSRQAGWEYLGETRDNSHRTLPVTRYWGVDHWAARTMQGAYLNWVVGNAIVPPVDNDPAHEGIEVIDRSTVLELAEIPNVAADLQTSLDNAEGSLNPLGLTPGSIAFDVNPSQITGANALTHFEQIYSRAKVALNNALAAFDDAKDVTRRMRSEEDSVNEFQSGVAEQELAYNHKLIEIYGSPYPDDVGPGKTYAAGYNGPDLLHFPYVDNVMINIPGLADTRATRVFKIDIQQKDSAFDASKKDRFSFYASALHSEAISYLGIQIVNGFDEGVEYVNYTLNPHGFFQKPTTWTGRRAAPGKAQQAISQVILAHNALLHTLADNESTKYELDRQLEVFLAKLEYDEDKHAFDEYRVAGQAAIETAVFAYQMYKQYVGTSSEALEDTVKATLEGIPKSLIAGTAIGGDTASTARGIILAAAVTPKILANQGISISKFLSGAFKLANENAIRIREILILGPHLREVENQQIVFDLEKTLSNLQSSFYTINQRAQEFDEAMLNYYATIAEGDRVLEEREIFRQRSAAVVQGFRTRDAAFRIFRSEKLERYRTLFDLAARYSFLAANAYDYETGLLDTEAGSSFISRIVASRSLGVVRNGEPQYAGSNTGDPGLSSALAEMKADWDSLRGRLGFNNPDAYGTTVSLRTENFRVLPNTDGAQNWKNILLQSRMANIMDDADVRRYCMQAQSDGNLPVPGLVISFETTIADGLNLFGRPRAAGDHWFSPSSFATKIFAAGVAFEGYKGMDNPAVNAGAVGQSGGTTPSDPSSAFLDPEALGATPYIYLIPVGVDAMRSPPLGDLSQVRTWNVADVSIPLPFNIGGSDFSTKALWQSSASLTEPLFNIRKHQAFRPVSTTAVFTGNIYGVDGQLMRSQYSNTRLIGRSVWNTKWKIVIPGRELLNDPEEGLNRFIQTVKDVKLHFVTYSYSGN